MMLVISCVQYVSVEICVELGVKYSKSGCTRGFIYLCFRATEKASCGVCLSIHTSRSVALFRTTGRYVSGIPRPESSG